VPWRELWIWVWWFESTGANLLPATPSNEGRGDVIDFGITTRRNMAAATRKNQERIIANEKKILGNQGRLVRILDNQSRILRDLHAMLKNQKKILVNQSKILAK
jgi:hypothetical protein